MKKILGQRIARRNRTLVELAIITIFAIILLLISLNYKIDWLKEMVAMAIGAFLSTILSIYITKDDILENDYSEKGMILEF